MTWWWTGGGGGGGTGTGWAGEVANFAALPAATGSGDVYLVLASTGFLWNKRKGLYRDEGVWSRLSNTTFEVLDTEATFSDEGDDTKKMDFELSAITTGNTRTITMADRDVDLSNVHDPEKSFIISPSGGDYTTIQEALDDNTSGGELFVVYPGVYTDTINFTANNQCVIGHGNAPQQIVQQADATVVNFGVCTNCYIERLNIKLTAPTAARDMMVGTGDLLLQLCRLELTQSAAITGVQSTIINTSGTIRMYLSTCYYANTSVAAGGDRKEMFNLTGTGSLIATSVEFEFANTGTSFVSAVTVLDVTTTTLDVTDSKITGSSDSGIAAGIVDVTIGGSHGSHDNIYIISSDANDAYGIYASGTGTYSSSQNHFHIDSASGNAYGFLVGGSMTVKSAGDDIIALNNNSVAGTLTQVSSYNHEDFDITGTLTVDTAFSGSAFLDEDDMSSNSATKVASQQSIKAYSVAQTDWLQNGFADSSDVSIAWSDSTPDRTLTVSPAVTSYDYFIQGKKYNETGNLTEQITDTEGLWVIYFDSEGTLTSVRNPSHAQIDAVIMTKTIVAYVYWDATNNDGRLMSELHEAKMSPATHHWLHDNMGAVYSSGMALGDFDIDQDGNTTTDAQFSIAAGDFYDEDIEHELSAVTSTTGVEIWYLDGTDWRWTTRAGYSFRMTGGEVRWNDGGTQADVGGNDFCLGHVFATNITDDNGANPKYIAIQGQYEYGNRGDAREGAETEINELVYGTLPLQEIIPVATFIIQNRGTYGALRTTESGDNYVDWRSSNLKGAGGTVADHGALAGLSDNDHPQYAISYSTTETLTTGTWTDGKPIYRRAWAGTLDNNAQEVIDANFDNTVCEKIIQGNFMVERAGGVLVDTNGSAYQAVITFMYWLDGSNGLTVAKDHADLKGQSYSIWLEYTKV